MPNEHEMCPTAPAVELLLSKLAVRGRRSAYSRIAPVVDCRSSLAYARHCELA